MRRYLIIFVLIFSIISIVNAASTNSEEYEGDHYIIHCNVVGAKVTINGEPFGEIGESHYLDVYYKEYWVKPFLVIKKSGYEEYWEQLEPTLPGIPEHVETYLDSQNPKELGCGNIRFESEPKNAEIYIKRHGTLKYNWERVGRTPYTAYYLPAVPYDVIIQIDGYMYEWKKIFVTEGTTIDEYFILDELKEGEIGDYFILNPDSTPTPTPTPEIIIQLTPTPIILDTPTPLPTETPQTETGISLGAIFIAVIMIVVLCGAGYLLINSDIF